MKKVCILSTILFLCVFYASVSTADLVGHWKFDETTGTIAADSSGNYNVGILGGSASFDTHSTSDRFSNPAGAINLNGTYYINCGHDFTVDPTNGLTLAAWVKPNGTQVSWATVIDKEHLTGGPAGDGYTLMVNGTKVASWMANGPNFTGAYTDQTVNIADGNWHFIAATQNGSGIQTYVDGVSDGSFVAMSPAPTSSQPDDLAIGAAILFGRYFNGAIDEVAIWDSALNAAGIQDIYNNGITDPVITEPFECILWLKADAGVADPNGTPIATGGVVGKWLDQSGKEMDTVRQWGDPTLETSTFPNGSHPVVHFNGNDGLVLDPNAILNADASDIYPRSVSVYVVGRIDDLALGQVFLANFSDPSAGTSLGISNTSFNTAEYFDTRGGVYEPDEPLQVDRYYLLSYTISYDSERKVYLNGELLSTDFGRPTYNLNTIGSIGAMGSGTEFLTGDIAEIKVYKGVNVTEHANVTTYLMNKYQIDTSEPPAPDPTKVTLTALTLTRCNSIGTMIETERWNTFYPDAAWDTAIFEGAIPADPNAFDPNLFLNHPNYMMIYIPLQAGEQRTFTWYNARGLTDVPYFGVNLFFDGKQAANLPGLSVYAQMDADGPGNGHPEFKANSAGSTMGWPISSVAGTGSLSYKDLDKKLKVTMTDFVTYHQDVYHHDLITAQTAGHPLDGPDGAVDMIGQFTLKVEQNLFCADLGVYFDTDINEDCSVDLADMAYLVSDWLKCNDPLDAECTDVP
jgi:hypothetical protein